MLARSPAVHSQASPNFGHYAFESPVISSSRNSITASLSRASSFSSRASSQRAPQTRALPRYVDSATQWSPLCPKPLSQSSVAPIPASIPPTPPGPRAMTPGIEQGAGQVEPPRARPGATSYDHTSNNGSSFSGGSVRSAPLGMDTMRDVAEGSSVRRPATVSASSSSAASKKRNEPTAPDHEERESSPTATQSSSPKRPRAASRPLKVLPQRYEACPVSDMVVLIANMIGELIETNDPLQRAGGQLTRFHSRTAPGISVVEYLRRLAKHATVPTPLLLVVVYYMDRLCAVYKEFTINTLTVHRFLITAVTVASKGLSDAFWNNTTYARVGGLKVAELRLLELEFLYRMDWKIIPNPESLEQYYRGLVQRHSSYCLPGDESQPQQPDVGEEPSKGKAKEPEITQPPVEAGETEDEDGEEDEDDEDEDDEDDEMDVAAGEGETPDTGTTSPSRS